MLFSSKTQVLQLLLLSVCAFSYGAELSIDNQSLLTFVQQSTNVARAGDCPPLDTCMKHCRKGYSVERAIGGGGNYTFTLTSTYTDTNDCVCDKLIFTWSNELRDETEGRWENTYTYKFDYTIPDSDNGDITFLSLGGVSSTVMNITLFDCYECSDSKIGSGIFYEECYWEYSIGTSSSPAATLTGLLGLISASVVAFVLV